MLGQISRSAGFRHSGLIDLGGDPSAVVAQGEGGARLA
jgi:hypothetical protein